MVDDIHPIPSHQTDKIVATYLPSLKHEYVAHNNRSLFYWFCVMPSDFQLHHFIVQRFSSVTEHRLDQTIITSILLCRCDATTKGREIFRMNTTASVQLNFWWDGTMRSIKTNFNKIINGKWYRVSGVADVVIVLWLASCSIGCGLTISFVHINCYYYQRFVIRLCPGICTSLVVGSSLTQLVFQWLPSCQPRFRISNDIWIKNIIYSTRGVAITQSYFGNK